MTKPLHNCSATAEDHAGGASRVWAPTWKPAANERREGRAGEWPVLGLFCFSLLLGSAILAGCKSTSMSRYVSPRVIGRVLDSSSEKPIEHVKVRRITADDSYRIQNPPKGGQLMEQTPAVLTGSDGRFVLDSTRSLSLFGTWYSVTISFEHPGYQRFSTTYTVANVTNTLQGEPVINGGDILLAPEGK
jgi:hypothetical protein